MDVSFRGGSFADAAIWRRSPKSSARYRFSDYCYFLSKLGFQLHSFFFLLKKGLNLCMILQ